ncbi:hypothetical protein EXQ42_06515 [Clostridium botulinum]|uniref:hypothetical protein n=2 Tax=Clostridium botulinum TaxID=1491 RepID=UPI0005862683|nr:hypothetical protein [Clostridium botulinum]AJE13314.1 hypothetical protein T259_4267 [Clostridium botulinum CDC_1436]MBO0526694.1 hypothetical protein [Clostridium botulinum]MBO0527004.1 hypothetical protein [Clostridium botulinum]MBO0532483.1 hypothetical protein [Clostridium botulinum]MBO0534406.1 hypothetical protein [Clostridium botulinum]
MFKLTLKLFNNKKEKDNIDLFLQQLRENNIYFPGDGGGAMKHFIKEAIEKGFIKIVNVGTKNVLVSYFCMRRN